MNINFNFKNFNYPNSIQQMLNTTLTNTDLIYLDKIYKRYDSLNIYRNYEPIITDLYILIRKFKLSTKQLSQIYDLNIRTIQIWLKELGLNRSYSQASKISKSQKNDFILDKKDTEKEVDIINANPFGIEIERKKDGKLPYFVVDFLNYLETIKGKSPNTLDGYTVDLSLFFRFLLVYKGVIKNSNIEFGEIPISDVNVDLLKQIKLIDLYAFLSFLEKQRNNGSYARARKVATLKSFFKFLCGKAKIIEENPTLDLESPKINKRNPVYLSLDESLNLLNSLDKNHKNYHRDYCILTLFLNCGMRLSELCGIQIDKIKGDTLTIIGKGNKERTVYLNKACINSINNYLLSRDESNIIPEHQNTLFISSQNKGINKRTVELLVKKHIRNSGIYNEKYTPHKLRHTAATLMYKYGEVDIRSLQSILGHENISTTQIYTHVDDDTLRNAVKSNPLSKLK